VKLTVPVGTPEPGALAVTAAVNVTCWPLTDGFADEVTTVAVGSRFTVCASELDDPAKLESPE
jgi:hypothetical protein